MNVTPPISPCRRCGAVIPPDAPRGLCPRCMLAGVAESTESVRTPIHRQAPSLESVRTAFPALEILELIGSGGMGFVYAARQPHLDRKVALKLLPVAVDSDPAFAERFAREGRLLARLNHPNIVAVYEFGEVPGFRYLILEYVDGVNLRQAMLSGRFSPPEALAIVPRICEALQYAHEQGVLHRDIKPENLLLDSRGRVKIADFGIAKMVGDRTNDITLTAGGARLGTPHYMAPEQIESPSAVDHRADIYSLGVVFYELLTGELPLGRFGPPSSKASLDARIDEIVMRALAKERELRQQSADEVRTQVEGLERGASMPGAFVHRARHSGFGGAASFEYRSPGSIGGLPWIHIVAGIDPKTGRSREAHGVLALGPRARGVIAMGGFARGFVAIGGGALGVVSFGGFAMGGLAVGGFAGGIFSFGGFALALWVAMGGLAIGWEALGGLAIGYRAVGGLAYSSVPSLLTQGWGRVLLNWLPWLWVPSVLMTLLAVVGSMGLTAWASRRARGRPGVGGAPEMRPNPWPHRLYWLLVGPFMVVASAVVAALGLPILMRTTVVEWGQLHPGWFRPMTILLGWLPVLVGGFVVLRYRQTRPTSARATPVSEWNPWPKRIFMGLLILIMLPLLLFSVGVILPRMMARPLPLPGPVPIPKAVGARLEAHLHTTLPAGQTTRFVVRYWSNGIPRVLPPGFSAWHPGDASRTTDHVFELFPGTSSGPWLLATSTGSHSEIVFPGDVTLDAVSPEGVALAPGSRARRWLFLPVNCEPARIRSFGGKWTYVSRGPGEERWLNGIAVDIEPQDVGDLDNAVDLAAERLAGLERARDQVHPRPANGGGTAVNPEDLDHQILEARRSWEALQRAAAGGDATSP